MENRQVSGLKAGEADYSIPGMRIQAGIGEWALMVRTAARQVDWVAEPQGEADRVSIMVTPTTIRYRGGLYRIHESAPAESGWIYRMQPCHDGESLHQVVDLSREAVAREAAERKEFEKIQHRAHISAGYEMALGWLPARWQERLSRRWHFSPADATRKNGMAMFLLGLGAAFPAMTLIERHMGFVMLLLAVDGATRWAVGFAAEQAVGFLPLELAVRVVGGVGKVFGIKQEII